MDFFFEALITSYGRLRSLASAKVKFSKLFPGENLDWKTVYKIPFLTTIDLKTKTFWFKSLHRILFSNSALFKMKFYSLPLCTFCGV